MFGLIHPATLASLNNLAGFYFDQGRYAQAEPHFEQALQLSSMMLGDTDPNTIISRNNLALLYHKRGRYELAESYYKKTLQMSRETLGDTHPSTLNILNNLALLFHQWGRYSEAEPRYEKALRLRRETLGESHPDTLISLNNLAGLYQSQGRYEEAEWRFLDVLKQSRKTKGKSHPDTLSIQNNLAFQHSRQGRYSKAEPLYKEVLQLRRKALGDTHPETLISFNNLAFLYKEQDRYGEAEPLFEKALRLRRETLGESHPDTLISLGNQATLYQQQGNYDEAELHLGKALQLSNKTLGKSHPSTLDIRNDLALLLYSQQSPDIARTIDLLEKGLEASATRLESELYSAPSDASRPNLLRQTESYNLAVNVAASGGHVVLGARALLLSKGIAGEIDASLRRVEATEPALANSAIALRQAEASYAQALSAGKRDFIEQRLLLRDKLRRELAAKSRVYADTIDFETLHPEKVTEALSKNAIFLDYGIYEPINFETGQRSSERVVLVLYRSDSDIELHDLGPFSVIARDIDRLSRLNELEILPQCKLEMMLGCPKGDQFADLEAMLVSKDDHPSLTKRVTSTMAGAKERLADFLLGPLHSIHRDTQLIISPDGALHRINFGLLAQRGRHLFETNELRIIPHGRILVRSQPEPVAAEADLFTMGGGDYGDLPDDVSKCENQSLRADASFCPLPYSENEAERVATLAEEQGFSVRGPHKGRSATEERAKAEMPGSRIVHLATHGGTSLISEGLGLYNVALAFTGANDTLRGQIRAASDRRSLEDGLLYGYEASRLPLYGTELVTLSACETGRGDDAPGSEGLYSLAYAFRLAGAENVLMSLWNVSDRQTGEFMEMFYDTWFDRRSVHPGETAGESLRRALRDTQLNVKQRGGFSERHWAAFVLVEN